MEELCFGEIVFWRGFILLNIDELIMDNDVRMSGFHAGNLNRCNLRMSRPIRLKPRAQYGRVKDCFFRISFSDFAFVCALEYL